MLRHIKKDNCCVLDRFWVRYATCTITPITWLVVFDRYYYHCIGSYMASLLIKECEIYEGCCKKST